MNQNKLFQTLVSKEAAEFSGEAGEFRCLSLVHNFHDSFRSSCQPWLYPKPTVSRLVGSVRARTWRRLFWLVIARLWPSHFLELITQIANLSLEDVNLFFKFVIQLFPTQS